MYIQTYITICTSFLPTASNARNYILSRFFFLYIIIFFFISPCDLNICKFITAIIACYNYINIVSAKSRRFHYITERDNIITAQRERDQSPPATHAMTYSIKAKVNVCLWCISVTHYKIPLLHTRIYINAVLESQSILVKRNLESRAEDLHFFFFFVAPYISFFSLSL